jgi:3-dehydroquinate dehydratase I
MVAPPRICVPIINDSQIISPAESVADLYEVRIDLIGKDWRKIAAQLKIPWVACNRRVEEGGRWQEKEDKRIKELLSALDIGASYIDIELGTTSVETIAQKVKERADVIISYHNLVETPPIGRLRQIVRNQLAAGADICKVVTTAHSIKDNATMLELINFFPEARIISFAMGIAGQISRLMSPLVGGFMTWGSTEEGSESAEGQMTAVELRRIYRCLKLD